MSTVRAFLALLTAALEARTVVLQDYAKRYADREWSKGYAEGFRHGQEGNQ